MFFSFIFAKTKTDKKHPKTCVELIFSVQQHPAPEMPKSDSMASVLVLFFTRCANFRRFYSNLFVLIFLRQKEGLLLIFTLFAVVSITKATSIGIMNSKT